MPAGQLGNMQRSRSLIDRALIRSRINLQQCLAGLHSLVSDNRGITDNTAHDRENLCNHRHDRHPPRRRLYVEKAHNDKRNYEADQPDNYMRRTIPREKLQVEEDKPDQPAIDGKDDQHPFFPLLSC
jgi:hypothetical protein